MKTLAMLFAAQFAGIVAAQALAPASDSASRSAGMPPAFTVGVFIPEDADMDCGVPMHGYPAAMTPLYESLPDRKVADSLGIGAFGIMPNHDWRWIFRRKPLMPRRNLPELRRPMNAGLPLVGDISIVKGSHAWMPYMEGVRPKENAWIKGQVFGFPFSLADSEAIEFWQTVWRYGAKWFAEEGVAPDAWFLFRDADWWDESDYARREFSKHLSAKYKTPAELNAALKSAFSSAAAASRTKNVVERSEERSCRERV